MREVASVQEFSVRNVMAKGFTTTTLVRGKEPFLRQIVCEVRYQDGHLYLDHCGRLLKSLLRSSPEWVVAPEPTTQGTVLHHLSRGLQLSFSRVSASLSLDRSSSDEVIATDERAEFVEAVEAVLGAVLDELEVAEFTRVGYREYYYFSFESKEDSEKWLQELGLVTVAPTLYEAFSAKLDALGVGIVMQGPDCRYRIGLNGIERSAQVPVGETVLTVRASATPKGQKQALLEILKKKRQRQIDSAVAAVVDIDAFLLDPPEIHLGDFLREHAETNLLRFREALPKESSRKGK